MKPLVKIKKLFFTKDKIGKYLDKKTFYVLNKFGGLVRKTAQRSMRTRKGHQPSGKGLPPFSHGKKLLRKLLFYTYDKRKKTVIIGPLLLQRTRDIKVPKLMEHGGTITARVRRETVVKDYKGNPFMRPAFQVHIGKVAAMYKNKL